MPSGVSSGTAEARGARTSGEPTGSVQGSPLSDREGGAMASGCVAALCSAWSRAWDVMGKVGLGTPALAQMRGDGT